MRAVVFVGSLYVLLAGSGFGVEQGAAARNDTKPGRAECKKLALEKRALDKAGMRSYLEKSPESVAAERGRPFVEQMQHYIALSETVLFKCPRHVLNANVGRLNQRSAAIPPLPVKGPFRARIRKPRRSLVPLPVKRQSRHLRATISAT
ncbi:MAG: hypothetical protein JXQ99_20990 [Hyphomicrobiaceae bacterium]